MSSGDRDHREHKSEIHKLQRHRIADWRVTNGGMNLVLSYSRIRRTMPQRGGGPDQVDKEACYFIILLFDSELCGTHTADIPE